MSEVENLSRVLLLLCKGVEIYEAAAFYDVLGWSGVYGTEAVEVVTAGLQNEVQGTFGIKIIPDQLLSEVKAEDFEALALPGGFETYGYYEEAYSEAVADLVRRFENLKKPIASICVGALPLANSGILEGRQATTYHLRDGLRRKQLASFGVNVIDEPIVRDNNVITSTSPATAMDVAFDLLASITSRENAAQIRHKMGFDDDQADSNERANVAGQETKTARPIGGGQRVINQGDIYWIPFAEPDESASGYTHPHVVIQDNVFNHSRINTLVVCALTSNLKRAKDPGNVLLEIGEANLPRQSVVVVSQVSTVDKTQLGEYIGSLTEPRIKQILAGMQFLQVLIDRRQIT